MILKTFANYPPRKRIGILAILLAVLSIFAGSPMDKVNTTINTKEMSLISKEDITKIKVTDLADNIIKSKFDYRLIDLRDSKKYETYNIPSSENIQIDQLLKSDVSRNEKILLYSDNDIESSLAWFLLKSNKYKGVSILEKGLESWKKNVLYPICNCNIEPTGEQKNKHNKLKEVSLFFGGKMKTTTFDKSDNSEEMPALAAPAKITLKRSKGKKKREGC